MTLRRAIRFLLVDYAIVHGLNTAHTGRPLSTYIYIADELYVYGHIISKAAVAVAHTNERELLL